MKKPSEETLDKAFKYRIAIQNQWNGEPEMLDELSKKEEEYNICRNAWREVVKYRGTRRKRIYIVVFAALIIWMAIVIGALSQVL